MDPIQYEKAENFTGTDRSITPLQFLYSLRLPLLGLATTVPVFHSVGISSLSYISFDRLYKTSMVALISAFKTSDGTLSIPGALPSLSFLKALLISSLDILPQLMLMSSVASSMYGIESGGGLFTIYWKCSFQRCNCRDSLVRKFSLLACLSLIGRLVLLLFPASCLVNLYSSLGLFCIAAISASFASFSINVLLALFIFLLTVLFFPGIPAAVLVSLCHLLPC